MATVAQLIGITELFEAAGKAMSSVVDAIRSLASASKEGLDYVHAKHTRDRLIDISARSILLIETQKAGLLGPIDIYLDNPYPLQWTRVAGGISQILGDVNKLLADLQKERSDLVLEPTYQKLVSALKTRTVLLQNLGELPPPSTDDELTELNRLNLGYKKLLSDLNEAANELNAFVKGTT